MTISPLPTSSSLFLSAPGARAGQPQAAGRTDSQSGPEPENQPAETPRVSSSSLGQATSPSDLTAEEQRVVAQLQRIDSQVRAHEQAHLSAAAGIARGVSFSYVTGPDGKRYAVGGEVAIDASAVDGNPEATVRKAQQIRAAASAPANPSAQDRQVAAQASHMEQAARQELAVERRQEIEDRARTAQVQAFENQGEGSSGLGQLLDVLA